MSALEALREAVKHKVEEADMDILQEVNKMLEAQEHAVVGGLTWQDLPDAAQQRIVRAQAEYKLGKERPYAELKAEMDAWRTIQ